MAELQKVLSTDAQRWLTDLDDGTHSGLERTNAKGMFFYFTAPREGGRMHFWRYYALQTRKIIDNHYHIMQLIACSPDTPRFPPPYHDVDVFEIQENIIANILGNVEQQQVAALINKPVTEEQTLASQILQRHLNSPNFERSELRELRKFLSQPLVGAAVQQLRKALQTYSTTNGVWAEFGGGRGLRQSQGASDSSSAASTKKRDRISRDSLTLMCYEYIS